MTYRKKGEWFELEVPKNWDMQSVASIFQTKWNVPKKLVHQFRMDKRVQLNGRSHFNWQAPVHAGDRLLLRLFVDEEYGVEPQFMPVPVCYEDDHLLIVNKPAGVDTHPNEGKGSTLANAIAFHLQANGIQTKVRHIHRLDRNTSGGVVFAKHRLAGAMLDQLLAKKLISRTYIAFVHGRVKQKQGMIDLKIGRDRHHATRRRVSKTGQSACTHYEVLQYVPQQKITLLRLTLETGRTHQIRVHLSYLGHPIVGDVLYGGRTQGLQRQALHAEKIAMIHPFSREELEVGIPWSEDLKRFAKHNGFFLHGND